VFNGHPTLHNEAMARQKSAVLVFLLDISSVYAFPDRSTSVVDSELDRDTDDEGDSRTTSTCVDSPSPQTNKRGRSAGGDCVGGELEKELCAPQPNAKRARKNGKSLDGEFSVMICLRV
jgi:hypothetical protein